MFLAEKYITRSCLKARQEGFEEGYREGMAEAWAQLEPRLRRLEAAKAAGVEFTEPPPDRNRPAQTTNRRPTASAF